MIYTFKVWMFQGQFQLTANEQKGLHDLCLFYFVIYLKSWFECPLAACVPRNDLCLLQKLQKYAEISKPISQATSQKLAGTPVVSL